MIIGNHRCMLDSSDTLRVMELSQNNVPLAARCLQECGESMTQGPHHPGEHGERQGVEKIHDPLMMEFRMNLSCSRAG